MEEKRLEIVLMMGMVIFVVAIVGGAALFLTQGFGGQGNNSTYGDPASGSSGLIGFIESIKPGASGTDAVSLYGNVTVNGEVPRLKSLRLADGTTYGGQVTVNYILADQYAGRLGGATVTGSLIDSRTGAYRVDDVVRNVPFTVTIVLYPENETEPLTREIMADNSRAIYSLDQDLWTDFDLLV